MSYILGMSILIILCFSLGLLKLYFKINKLNDSVRRQGQKIKKLFQYRLDTVNSLFQENSVYLNDERWICVILEKNHELIALTNNDDIVHKSTEISVLLQWLLKNVLNSWNQREVDSNKYINMICLLEKQIQLAWNEYDSLVYIFNKCIKQFPYNIGTSLLGVAPLSYLIKK